MISRGIDVPQVRMKGVLHVVCSMPSLTEVTLVVNYELPISFNDQWRGVNMEPCVLLCRNGCGSFFGILLGLLDPYTVKHL